MEMARRAALVPIAAMESNRQVFRPIRSARGAPAIVTTRLIAEMITVSKADLVGKILDRMETEYMMMLFIPDEGSSLAVGKGVS